MNKKIEKIGIYLVVSILVAFFEAILIGIISEAFPDTTIMFGIPFAFSYFVLAITIMMITIAFFLFLPKKTKKQGRLK